METFISLCCNKERRIDRQTVGWKERVEQWRQCSLCCRRYFVWNDYIGCWLAAGIDVAPSSSVNCAVSVSDLRYVLTSNRAEHRVIASSSKEYTPFILFIFRFNHRIVLSFVSLKLLWNCSENCSRVPVGLVINGRKPLNTHWNSFA